MNRVEATEIVQKIQDECKKHDDCFDCPFCVDKFNLDTYCVFTARDGDEYLTPLIYKVSAMLEDL